LALNMSCICFSDSIYIVFACNSDQPPPSMGVAPVQIVRIHEVLEFSGKFPRTSRRCLNNVAGTIVPIFVLVGFLYA
jgi:hypothetical protein